VSILKTEYDTFNLHQKGKWNKPWSCNKKYWEADCVGFTEHVHEWCGGNPIVNEPRIITSSMQADSMIKVSDC
jgi:hypothetical protein